MRAKIYGIKNCDTMKKAFQWLTDHGVRHEFHDYKKSGVSASLLNTWSATLGWEALLNVRGTTWRKLPESDRQDMNEAKALQLMAQHPSLIKRPVLDHGGHLLLGFKADDYQHLFGR